MFAAAARAGLIDVLTSGMVAPLNGQVVIQVLQSPEGPGLFDRFIPDDYRRDGLETLTLDRRMATLPNVHRLQTARRDLARTLMAMVRKPGSGHVTERANTDSNHGAGSTEIQPHRADHGAMTGYCRSVLKLRHHYHLLSCA